MLTRVPQTCQVMALLKYLKPCSKDGLPDPKGSLSAVVPSRAIARANQEVQQTLADQSDKSGRKKRGPYKKYVDSAF